MNKGLMALLVAVAGVAEADEYVTPSPGPSEVGRFVVARSGPMTLKLDSATGASWYLCPSAKGKRLAWCRFREVPGLASGPTGRYRLLDGSPILMVDSVSGRAWARCELPTPERGEAWCLVDE